MSDSVHVEIIAPDAFGGIEAAWRALWRSVAAASPLLAPAWLGAWAEVYAPGRIWAAALRDGGRLVGLLPVFVWDGALLLAGTGPSDHGGLLILPEYEPWTGALLDAAAQAVDATFERMDLQQLAPGSPLATAAPPGWQARTEDGDPCLVVPLGGEQGMDVVPARMRANWRYALRRLEREECAVDLVAPAEMEQGIAELERLHGLRWRERDEPGMLADPLLRDLVRTAAPRLATDGLLRLHRIRFGGDTIAVLLVVAAGASACYYLGGFDPDCARLSPGTALVGAAIAAAAEAGATTFDFLRGAEPYKYRWGARDQRRVRRLLTRA